MPRDLNLMYWNLKSSVPQFQIKEVTNMKEIDKFRDF